MQVNGIAVAGMMIAAFHAMLGKLGELFVFIYERLTRMVIYKSTTEQSDKLYGWINFWVTRNYPHKLRNVEAITVENVGDWDRLENNIEKGVKLRHYSDFIWIWYNRRLVFIRKQREKMENAENFTQAFLGRIIIWGPFARKQVQQILRECEGIEKLLSEREDTIKIMSWDDGYWDSRRFSVFKNVDRMFFPEKDAILEQVRVFQNSKELYRARGIEWYLGLLFWGLPGSGKTGFAKALADFTNRTLYTIKTGSITDQVFTRAFNQIGKNALLLLDDIDIGMSTREDKKDEKLTKGVSVATLLGSLDGASSRSDLIVIMTTNNKDKLDPALIRKGRIDGIYQISYPDHINVIRYIESFYQINVVDEHRNRIQFKGQMVDLQHMCLNNNPEETIRILCENKPAE